MKTIEVAELCTSIKKIMVVRKQCPQIYWSQTDGEVNLYIDLLLDDMVCTNFSALFTSYVSTVD